MIFYYFGVIVEVAEEQAATFYSVIQSSLTVNVSYRWGGLNFTGLS
jgi:hypothetical protein